MRQKKLIFILSLILLLPLASCGKKSNPVPKSKAPVRGSIDLAGEVKDGLLFLSFSRGGGTMADATGFTVLRSCSGCGGGFETWKDIRLVEKRGYTIERGRIYFYDNELIEGYDYAYRVIPYTATGVPLDGSRVFSIKWGKTPPPPDGVKAVEGDGTIEVQWKKEGDYRYNVYRFDNGGYPLFPLNPELLMADHLIDSALVNGKRYRYEVRAVRLTGSVRWEGEGAALEATPVDRTPPEAPKELTAAKRDGAVELSWRKNTEKDLLGYNVYRMGTNKNEKLTPKPVEGTSFLDRNPGEARYVSYYVTALDTAGNESEPSRETIIILKE